jgi:hypothetical protein
VLKFVSDLRQVGGFPQPIKVTANDIIEILLKVALNTIKPTQTEIKWVQMLFVSSNKMKNKKYHSCQNRYKI